MSDNKKQVCGRHFVSGQGIVTICGDAPAPAVGEAVYWVTRIRKACAEFNGRFDQQQVVAGILEEHAAAAEARVRAEVWGKAASAVHTYKVDEGNASFTDRDLGHCAGKNEAFAEIYRAALADGIDLTSLTDEQ